MMSVRQLRADGHLKVMPDDVHALCRGWLVRFSNAESRRARHSPRSAERYVAECRDLERRFTARRRPANNISGHVL
jgi:hypothetical protein